MNLDELLGLKKGDTVTIIHASGAPAAGVKVVSRRGNTLRVQLAHVPYGGTRTADYDLLSLHMIDRENGGLRLDVGPAAIVRWYPGNDPRNVIPARPAR